MKPVVVPVVPPESEAFVSGSIPPDANDPPELFEIRIPADPDLLVAPADDWESPEDSEDDDMSSEPPHPETIAANMIHLSILLPCLLLKLCKQD